MRRDADRDGAGEIQKVESDMTEKEITGPGEYLAQILRRVHGSGS